MTSSVLYSIFGSPTHYAGVNIINLDIFQCNVERFAPDTNIIVIVDKSDRHEA